MVTTEALSTEECESCKSPTKETIRSLCTTCLNKSLQRACQKNTVVLSDPTTRMFRGVPRALFPGMPRAVLGPSNLEKGHHVLPWCRTTTTAGFSATPSSRMTTPYGKSEVDAASLRDTSNDSQSQKVELTDEMGAEGRAVAGLEQRNELRFEEIGGGNSTEKWHLFQVQKNLTVRIPNPLMGMSMRPGRCQPFVVPSKGHWHNCLPPRKEVRPRASVRPSHVKRLSIKPNASAEAELMMRLLSDSMPILKSTAPIVLPPCKVRPAQTSPLSPTGDPLWKRRCIPCPKSLKLQVTSICAN